MKIIKYIIYFLLSYVGARMAISTNLDAGAVMKFFGFLLWIHISNKIVFD